jgi:predicted nucleic acid-binding protein
VPSDAAYLDASAFFKLVLPEAESQALRSALSTQRWISSALLEVEVVLAVRRREPSGVDAARRVLAGVELIDIDPYVRRVAADLGDPPLRSLDAIHLATALSLEDHVGTVITYDQRLAAAAQAHGLPVTVPQP